MRLGFIERLFITHPFRPLLQEHFEARQLLRLGGTSPGARALEVGCGTGVGIELIYRRFKAVGVDAFDLDPRMVKLAWERKTDRAAHTNLWVGNVRQIPTSSNAYDAVFNFGTLHHVVHWRDALTEIHRVLKPGGRFYCEEILARFITHPIMGRLMVHPQTDRFDRPAFLEAAEQSGFRIIADRKLADLYLWVIAEKICSRKGI